MFTNLWKMMRENKFESDNEISSDLLCRICKRLMIKACNAPCGCRFCSDCIEQYLNETDKFCPGEAKYCQVQKINFTGDVLEDRIANLRISEVIVKCPRQNCETKTELSMMEEHMRTCDKRPISCPFNSIGCEINEIANEEMNAHLNESNYWHSKLIIDLINNFRNEMESLKNENMELRNEMTELKKKNRQSKQKIDNIEFQSTNQYQKMSEMEAKQLENTEEIKKINKEIVAVKKGNESLRKEMTELRRENREFKQQFDNIQSLSTNQQHKMGEMEAREQENTGEKELLNEEMVLLKNEYRSMSSQMETNAEAINQIRMQIERIEINSQQQSDALKQNCEQQQLQANKNVQLEMEKCANEIRQIQSIFGDEDFMKSGIFQWEIDKISEQRRNALIYSKPFYSVPFGYKMCLAVFIWDYIYVYFHLLRGDFDNNLEWPFKYSVKIDAIDSANGNIIHSSSVKYSDCSDVAGWRKPASDRNDPIRIYNYDCDSISIKSAAINNKLLLRCKIEKL